MDAEDPSEITEARFNLENLFKSDYPDVICSYPEVMFYVAEAYARGLGVTKDLTKADEYFKKGLEASCTNVGVAAAGANPSRRSSALSTLGGDEKVIEAIAAQQRIEMMMRPLEAWSEQRRTGYPKLEVPEMIRSLYTDLISRWPYPSRESLVNDNVPPGGRCLDQNVVPEIKPTTTVQRPFFRRNGLFFGYRKIFRRWRFFS